MGRGERPKSHQQHKKHYADLRSQWGLRDEHTEQLLRPASTWCAPPP
jgi:hypothetical protein